MHAKIENLFGWLALGGFLLLPIVLLLLIGAHHNCISGKQVTLDRARESLSAALTEIQTSGRTLAEPKQFRYFLVIPCTNIVVVAGQSYPLALVTSDWYQFDRQGVLAITTNRQYLWLDFRHGAKLISEHYHVPQWRTGY